MRYLDNSRKLAVVLGSISAAVACGAPSSDPAEETLGTVEQGVAAGQYMLQSMENGECVRVPGSATANGVQLVTGSCMPGQPSQVWDFRQKALGDFQLRNAHSGKCMVGIGKPPVNGSDIRQGRCKYWRSRWTGTDVLIQEAELGSQKDPSLCVGITSNWDNFPEHYPCQSDPDTSFALLPPNVGSCCQASTVPGCLSADPEVRRCVCATYRDCCATAWTQACVTAVDELGCGTCDLAMPDCPDGNLTGPLPVQVQGDTTGAPNSAELSCTSSTGNSDHTYVFTAPADGVYSISTQYSTRDTAMAVYDAPCGGIEIACNDDGVTHDGVDLGLQSYVEVQLVQDQSVTVVVDGYSTNQGPYVLNIYDPAMGPPPAPVL